VVCDKDGVELLHASRRTAYECSRQGWPEIEFTFDFRGFPSVSDGSITRKDFGKGVAGPRLWCSSGLVVQARRIVGITGDHTCSGADMKTTKMPTSRQHKLQARLLSACGVSR
jgi:hypothetical protein